MHESIVKFLADRGSLVQPEALDYLSSLSDPMAKLKRGLRQGREVPFVLTLEQARLLTGGDGDDVPEPKRLPEPEPVEAVERDPPPDTAPEPGPDPSPEPTEAPGSPEPTEPRPSPTSTPPDGTPDEPTDTSPTGSPEDRTGAVDEASDTPSGQETPTDRTEAPRTRGSPKPSTQPKAREAPSAQANGAPKPRGFRDEVKQVAEEVKVLLDVTGDSICEGHIEDFTKLFRDRYNRMRRLFRRRREMVGATTINRLKAGQPVKVIGIVNDVKTTKNGHRIIEFEDETGDAVALAPKSQGRLLELADTLLLDEVVGITGKMGNSRGGDGLIIIEEIVRPDLPLDRKPATEPGAGSLMVVSDIHIGADTFLDQGWQGFLDWMHDQVPSAGGDVRYLVINGDLVEGVGIYPGQEHELHIDNVVDQCKAAAEDLAGLPDELAIYVLPGNHDPVRPAEPQPAFPETLTEMFPDNVQFLGNPCTLSFNGVEGLFYHGVSLFDYFEALSNCSIQKPIETMVEMLRRRHICPIYGGKTPLAPEHRDYLCIDRVPDLFVTGHVHTAQTGEYRGTRLINASTWQEQTDYQRMMGFQPDPCKAFKIDLSDLGVKTFLFDHEEGTGGIQVENPDDPRHALQKVMAR